MFIAVFTESVLYWKPNVIQVVLTTKLYLTLVYNLMCLAWYVKFYHCIFIRCPLFMCHCLILTWSCLCDKRRRMLSSSNSYLLRISNMLSDIVPIAILSQALLPDHRLNVEQLYLLHKGVSILWKACSLWIAMFIETPTSLKVNLQYPLGSCILQYFLLLYATLLLQT
jgi:hypothetical protein